MNVEKNLHKVGLGTRGRIKKKKKIDPLYAALYIDSVKKTLLFAR